MTDHTLTDLLQRWDAHLAASAGRLASGVDDAAIDAATDPLGLHLPIELRQWWHWHNGGIDGPVILGATHMWLYPVADAVRLYRQSRQVAVGAQQDPPVAGRLVDDLWSPQWFPIGAFNGGARPVVVDLGDEGGRPVYEIDWASAPDVRDLMAPSLTAAVATWVDEHESGAVIWNGEEWTDA